MPSSNSSQNNDVQVTSPKASPRQININPKSARTVVHEIRTHHHGPVHRDGNLPAIMPTIAQPHVENTERKAGILPKRDDVSPRRRRESDQRRNKYHSYEPDSDSDFEVEKLTPRHHSPRNHRPSHSHSSGSGSHQGSSGRRYSSELTRYDDRREVVPVARRSNHSYQDSESDDSFDLEAELAEERRARNKRLLYTGLAAMTTVTCANGLYQTTKGYHIRRKTLREKSDLGELEDEIERNKHHRNHVAMNGLALVTVAISANNLRLGWQRHQEHKKKHEEAAARAWERKHRSQSHKAYSVEER